MNVHEEGVRRPSTLLANFVPVDAVEVHCHGTARAEGVAADRFRWETLFVEFKGSNGGFYDGVHVMCL